MPTRQPRPLLMNLGMGLATFVGVICTGLTLMPVLTSGGSYTVNDRPVTREYFLTHAAPITAVGAALLLPLAWGLWRERPWARPVPLAFWGAYTVFAVAAAEDRAAAMYGLAVGAVMLAWSGWYFYGNPNVTEYYAGLPRVHPQTRGAALGPPAT